MWCTQAPDNVNGINLSITRDTQNLASGWVSKPSVGCFPTPADDLPITVDLRLLTFHHSGFLLSFEPFRVLPYLTITLLCNVIPITRNRMGRCCWATSRFSNTKALMALDTVSGHIPFLLSFSRPSHYPQQFRLSTLPTHYFQPFRHSPINSLFTSLIHPLINLYPQGVCTRSRALRLRCSHRYARPYLARYTIRRDQTSRAGGSPMYGKGFSCI